MNELSLHNTVNSEVGRFLLSFSFSCRTVALNDILCEGLVEIVDMLSDYYEEGSHLYPSIVLFNDPQYLRYLPNIHHKFYEGDITIEQFRLCLKMCAPLAVDGWNIFLQVGQDSMSWGVISTEVRETSLSLATQIIKEKEQLCKVALISNIGMKTVALVSSGRESECIIHLSLVNDNHAASEDIDSFCGAVLENCEVKTDEFYAYFQKIVTTALHTGHGNLFGVIKETENLTIPELLKDGVNLISNPIDFSATYSTLLSEVDANGKVELNTKLKMMSGLTVSMMNHDGITLFTDTGKVVGYHYIVDNNVSANDVIVGGARTKAFHAMVQSGCFKCVFMRKQEGETNVVQSHE